MVNSHSGIVGALYRMAALQVGGDFGCSFITSGFHTRNGVNHPFQHLLLENDF